MFFPVSSSMMSADGLGDEFQDDFAHAQLPFHTEHIEPSPQQRTLKSILTNGSQIVQDAIYAEEPESLSLHTASPDVPPPQAPNFIRPPLSTLAHHPASPPRTGSGGHISPRSATMSSIAWSTRKSPRRSTSGFLSTSSADPPPLTRGRLYKPTLVRGLSATVPPAMTAVPVSPEFEDPQTLADFWAIYAREASQADRRMIANWNKNLDIRLIFSGIFSAILTPFIIESYKLLQGAGASTFFGKGGYRIRVNAMWFGSLIVSLIAALLCIHCKQWLDGYLADTVLHDRHSSLSDLKRACRLRQYRLQGLKRFHVQQIIGLLPVLLYIALLFFAIGLVDFLWHLSQAIAIYISVLCGIVAVFHIATTVTPFFTTRTPFKTPLSNLLGNLWRGMLQGRLVTRGLMEAEELEDVEKQAEILDRHCLKWLMKTTESDAYYGTAQRAGVEFERQQRRFSMSPALPTGARSQSS